MPSETFQLWFRWICATVIYGGALALTWAWGEWGAFLIAFLILMAHRAESKH